MDFTVCWRFGSAFWYFDQPANYFLFWAIAIFLFFPCTDDVCVCIDESAIRCLTILLLWKKCCPFKEFLFGRRGIKLIFVLLSYISLTEKNICRKDATSVSRKKIYAVLEKNIDSKPRKNIFTIKKYLYNLVRKYHVQYFFLLVNVNGFKVEAIRATFSLYSSSIYSNRNFDYWSID